jgi:hypothetical protein
MATPISPANDTHKREANPTLLPRRDLLTILAVSDPSWADLTRRRERDECREKLVSLGILGRG